MDNAKKIDWVIFRLSTAYGVSPRMRFDLTVNDFAMNAYTTKRLEVFLPYTYRPYIHVRDIAGAAVKLLADFQKCKNNVFNLGFSAENYQKIKIAGIIKEFMPDLGVEIVDKGIDLRDYQVDFSKIKEYLNITNRYTVRKGVEEVLGLLSQGKIDDPRDRIYFNTCIDMEDENEIRVGRP
jgi:nucleoside-diphosphate-sugar epimerase